MDTSLSNELTNYGPIGIVAFLMACAVVAIWIAYQKEVEKTHALAKEMVELLSGLKNVVEDVYSESKEMPNKVRDKIKPSLGVIYQKAADIERKINEERR